MGFVPSFWWLALVFWPVRIRSGSGGARYSQLHQCAPDAFDFDAPPHLRASAEHANCFAFGDGNIVPVGNELNQTSTTAHYIFGDVIWYSLAPNPLGLVLLQQSDLVNQMYATFTKRIFLSFLFSTSGFGVCGFQRNLKVNPDWLKDWFI